MAVKTVGYIGLGNAGFSFAGTIFKAGFEVIVRDVDPIKEEKFVKEHAGAKIARSNDDFHDVEILVTMLPNGKIVRDVILGDGGLARSLKPGTVVIDTSSSSPFDTRELGEELHRDYQIDLVDSPITQLYLHAIDTGEATLMVGSDSSAAIEKARPVLEAISRWIFVMGRLGTGHIMKTLNNYISVGGLLALCDSLVVGQKLGLDPKVMIDVLNAGTGRNFSTAYAFRDEVLSRRFESGYQLALLVKDMKITKDVIESAGFETRLPDLSIEYLSDALSSVQPTANHEECIRHWEKRAGIELKKSAQPTDKVLADIDGSAR